jgi:hypothetical protein
MSEEKKPCEEPCPKCGSPDINRQYRRRGERWDVGDGDAIPVSKFINRHNMWTREATRECITHHCRTCQFDWQTKPQPHPTK